MVGGAIGAIDHQFHPVKIHRPGDGAFTELGITTGGVIHSKGLTKMFRFNRGHRFIKLCLNRKLNGIGQFFPSVEKNFIPLS